jgi:Carboxypeptidase regulatory-like domain
MAVLTAHEAARAVTDGWTKSILVVMLDTRNSAARVATLPVILALLCSAVLHAQAGSGTISGVVFDSLGAPLPQAEVRIKNPANETRYQVVTSAKGEYSILGLPTGAYEIEVVVHGARMYFQKDVAVEPGKPLKLDMRLKETNLGAIGDDVLAAAALDRRPVPTGPAPRALDGHPDLSGVWGPVRLVEMGKYEMLPWAQAEMKRPDRISPNAFCLPQGPVLGGNVPFKFVQSPQTIVALTEDIFTYRQFHMDVHEHPKDGDPTWMGHSIGRWEGDTLVVDSANFNNKSWTPLGRPHTDKLHLVERFRRPDAGHLEYEMTIDDPGTYTHPWTIKFASNLLVGEEIGEYICTENEQDAKHYR